MRVDADEFKDAMARLSSHVTIVTAVDEHGRSRGFTASAVCSLSLDPPLLLVCVARSGAAHDAFLRADRFAVNVLRDSHRDLAIRFASRAVDRFAGTGFEVAGSPAPYLPDAMSVLICRRRATHPGGDHTILVGAVEMLRTSPGEPLVYFDRKLCGLSLEPAR